MEEVLRQIPMGLLVKKLHSVGKYYWTRPETSDCSVVVLLPPRRVSATYRRCTATPGHIHTVSIEAHDAEHCDSPSSVSKERGSSTASKPCSTPLVPSAVVPTHTEQMLDDSKRLDWHTSTSSSIGARSGINSRTFDTTPPSSSVSSACSQSPKAGTHATSPLQIMINVVRRESAPNATARSLGSTEGVDLEERCHTFQLHSDFLITQSSVFRKFFGDLPSLNLNVGAASSRTDAKEKDALPWTRQAPRLLSRPPGSKPALQLPIPSDVPSFAILIEYLYLGDFSRLTIAMDRGQVRWESVMLNAQYLGLDEDLKQKLGAWWSMRSSKRTVIPRATTPEARRSRHKGSSASQKSETERETDDLDGPTKAKRAKLQHTTDDGREGIDSIMPMQTRAQPAKAFTIFKPLRLPKADIEAPLSPATLKSPRTSSPAPISSQKSMRTGSSAVREWLGKTRRPRAVTYITSTDSDPPDLKHRRTQTRRHSVAQHYS